VNISKIKELDQTGFDKLMKESVNSVDEFIGIDEEILKSLKRLGAAKKNTEEKIKNVKAVEDDVREMMASFMAREKVEKLEGVKYRSVSYIAGVGKTRSLTDRQIMVSGRYQSLSEFSKDDLVSLLESKGVKTRVVGSSKKYKTEDAIRVYR